jgi:hypothetical protein
MKAVNRYAPRPSEKVGLALRAGLDFRSKRPPAEASHLTRKAASEKRPHFEKPFETSAQANGGYFG